MKRKKKKIIDWKGIEKDYRAGKTSIRQIADWYGLSEGAIRKRAKVDNWSQLMKPEPCSAVRRAEFVPAVQTPEDAKTISRDGKNLALRMLNELNAATSLMEELEDLIISESADDRDGRRRQGMLRAVDLPARANTLKTLGLAVKAFIEAERSEDKSDKHEDVASTTGIADKTGDDWDKLLN